MIYKPLYNNEWQGDKVDFTNRPIDMFIDIVDKPEYKGPRFRLIEDLDTIIELIKIRDGIR